MGILLGYSEVGYRVLLGRKITIARHVEVIGTDTKCIGVAENSFDKDNNDNGDNDLLVNMNKEELESREDENDNSLESLNIPRRSTRNKRTPVRYPEKENISEIHANYCSVDIPCTFEEAICCEDLGTVRNVTLGKCLSDQQLKDVEDLMTNPPRHGTLGYRHCLAKIDRFSR